MSMQTAGPGRRARTRQFAFKPTKRDVIRAFELGRNLAEVRYNQGMAAGIEAGFSLADTDPDVRRELLQGILDRCEQAEQRAKIAELEDTLSDGERSDLDWLFWTGGETPPDGLGN